MVREIRRRWRDYRTATGKRPVKEFISALSNDDQTEITAAMKDVTDYGLSMARHVRGEIYEVRASGVQQEYRVLFAVEGARSQILLSLEAFSKKTQKTPPPKIQLAERRLRDWRRRGRKR
ncbi:MAG: type II toxin-antitoxin system RelE/ParE family toxin [Actinomycetota bacterium]